jgi:hypothetical protein
MTIIKRYSTDPEQRLPPSPAKPRVRQCASASYDPETGRAARVDDDAYHGHGARHGKPESWKQMPDEESRYGVGNNTKRPTRPGRW